MAPPAPTGKALSGCRSTRARSCSIRPRPREKTKFHMINRETGPAEAADGGRRDRRCRGKRPEGSRLRVSKGEYVEIETEELKAIQIESTHTIEIDNFVPPTRSISAI